MSRVLYFISTLGTGGAERDVATICKHIDRSRFIPEVWTLVPGGPFATTVVESGTRLRSYRRRWANDPLFAMRLGLALACSQFDVIHVFNPPTVLYAALGKCFGGSKPVVYSHLGRSGTIGVQRVIFEWALRRMDAFVVNSLASADFLEEHGIKQHRMHIVRNGHEQHSVCDVERSRCRRELKIDDDEQLILYVGRLIESKRVVDLILACPIVLRDYPRIKVIVVGNGPEMAPLRRMVHDAGLGNVIQFLGERNDVPRLLGAGDIFAFPSESEGLPNSVIEAAMAGLPIAACDIPGVRSALADGQGGFLVPIKSPDALAAAIRQIINNPFEAQRRASIAKEYAIANFSIGAVLEQLYTVYDQVLERSGKR